jgi:hypothetical protein
MGPNASDYASCTIETSLSIYIKTAQRNVVVELKTNLYISVIRAIAWAYEVRVGSYSSRSPNEGRTSHKRRRGEVKETCICCIYTVVCFNVFWEEIHL